MFVTTTDPPSTTSVSLKFVVVSVACVAVVVVVKLFVASVDIVAVVVDVKKVADVGFVADVVASFVAGVCIATRAGSGDGETSLPTRHFFNIVS